MQKNAADKLVREFQRVGAVGAQDLPGRGHDLERDKKAAVNFGNGIVHIRAGFPNDKIGFFLVLFAHSGSSLSCIKRISLYYTRNAPKPQF